MSDTDTKIDRFELCLEKIALELSFDNPYIDEIRKAKQNFMFSGEYNRPYYKFIDAYFRNFKNFFKVDWYENFEDLKEIVEKNSEKSSSYFANIDRFRRIYSDLCVMKKTLSSQDIPVEEAFLTLGNYEMLMCGAYANTLISSFIYLREKGYEKNFLLFDSFCID